jgi:hypothetical protein
VRRESMYHAKCSVINFTLLAAVKIKKAKDVTKFKVILCLLMSDCCSNLMKKFLRSVAPSTFIHFALRIQKRRTSSSNHCRLV